MRLGDREFSLTACGEDKYLIHLKNVSITLDEQDFNGLTIIFRLLSVDELKIIDRLLPSNTDAPGNSGAISAESEEEIFQKCVFKIFGIEDINTIDMDQIEAGIISTIAGVILKTSYNHIKNAQAFISSYGKSISLFDQLKLYVCRSYNMSYTEVKELPIDQLIKLYAYFAATFPSEAINFNPDQNNE